MKKEDENLADNKRKERKIRSKEKCKIKTLTLQRQGKITHKNAKNDPPPKKEANVGVWVCVPTCVHAHGPVSTARTCRNMADGRVVSAEVVRAVDEEGWVLSACARLSFPVLFWAEREKTRAGAFPPLPPFCCSTLQVEWPKTEAD